MSARASTISTGRGDQGPYISKSKYLAGLQCHKLLWHICNDKGAIPEPGALQQAIFDQGHEVGQLAKLLFPGGIEVGNGVLDLAETLRLTQQALKRRQPLFEAAFSATGGYCRVDILRPALNDTWDLIEVKSTTSLKDVHLEDLAFQTWVMTMAGLKIRSCSLMHINPQFVRRGEIDLKKFFVLADVTDQTAKLRHLVEDNLDAMLKTVRQRQPPEIKIGPHCDDPYTCPLHDQCWSFLPEHNVLDLYRGTKKGFGVLDEDVTLLKNIPDGIKLTANQAIQKRVAISGKPHINRSAISKFLDRLEYPLHFLDFETIGTAIPLFDGARPYQQVPFQFSLHSVNAPGAEPEHRLFLAEGTGDPRPKFMRCLRREIGDEGSIVAFNAGFEKSRLEECAAFLPEFASWWAQIKGRFVDLLEPFRAFHYYHPDQGGSASMKVVLPALTGKGYDHLDIQEGGTASLEFLRVTFTDVDAKERQRVRRQLEEYCCQDTAGMVWILDGLRKL